MSIYILLNYMMGRNCKMWDYGYRKVILEPSVEFHSSEDDSSKDHFAEDYFQEEDKKRTGHYRVMSTPASISSQL